MSPQCGRVGGPDGDDIVSSRAAIRCTAGNSGAAAGSFPGPVCRSHCLMTVFLSRRRTLLGLSATGAGAALASLHAGLAQAASTAASTSPARRERGARMPVIFIGHGSPMNAIRRNAFTERLQAWGRALPRPQAILSVSAHWLTRGSTAVGAQAQPETIHDFQGFPRELQEMRYPAPGAPRWAEAAAKRVTLGPAATTTEWGLDHGTWTVLRHLYPAADVPVFQLSIDYDRDAAFHHAVGRELAGLREQGVLILGSGNIVHNLRATERDRDESADASRPWAAGFDAAAKKALDQRDDRALMAYERLDFSARMAVPTPDHYYPLMYALGAADGLGPPRHVFEGFHSGTLSMRCLQFG